MPIETPHGLESGGGIPAVDRVVHLSVELNVEGGGAGAERAEVERGVAAYQRVERPPHVGDAVGEARFALCELQGVTDSPAPMPRDHADLVRMDVKHRGPAEEAHSEPHHRTL